MFFSDNGSTAIEAAVKMALQYHAQSSDSGAQSQAHAQSHAHSTAGSVTKANRKSRFIALNSAFHGETIGAASLGGVGVFRRPFAGVLFDCIHVPSPAGEDGPSSKPGASPGAPLWREAFAAITELVEREHETIAGVVVEPIVQGTAGMRVYAPEYLRGLRELCTKYNVLMIVDEVFTGYGRLGKFWGASLAEVVPDVMCIAKGFTGGVLPMAATLTSQRVLDAFQGGREFAFLYGHSYCGNPLGCAVAREVLAIYREEHIVEGVAERHRAIAEAFERMHCDPVSARVVTSVRSIGCIGAADLRDETIGYTGSIGWRVYEEARRRGAYLRPLGNVVYVTPSLNIPMHDLRALLAIMEESVRAVAIRV
ncbi:MAG: hypothetical protein NVS3B20_22340 [Polyangiales bacterium]